MSERKAARPAILDASASAVTFERIAAFPPPGWQIPRHVELSPDGKMVTYLQAEGGGETMALFALENGKHRVLVRAADLGEKKMSREEELRRERERKRISGITDYAWARKSSVMLIPAGGSMYVRREDGQVVQIGGSPALDPKLCDDGTAVSFARESELWKVDVASGAETQLTSGAPEGVTRGQSDFNGQEEFSEPSGHWWAPTCDRIAYFEVDENDVGQVPVMGYRDGADLQQHRYPRTGTTNPRTRLGVLDLATKKTVWVQFPASDAFNPDDQYLGRVTWSHDGAALYFLRVSRSQQTMALVKADTRSGKAEHVRELSSKTWLDMVPIRALADGSLIWLTRHQGQLHIERLSGNASTMLTTGPWSVSGIVGVDEAGGRVLFLANKDAVLDRQLYAVPLQGGPIVRLSKEEGFHEVTTNHPEHGWVDIHSSNERLPRAVIHDAAGNAVGNIAVPVDPDFESLGLRHAELVELAGDPTLHGALLTPRKMEKGARYPVIVMVYGGPGVQTVQNQYNPRVLWQHLADRGFVVWQLDNRGSSGRGHDFEAPVYRKLGEMELADQLRGLDHLATLPYVDMSRVGIYGHSYGGYVTLLAMLRAPERFKVGVAGSPVTDWRFYDTGYTERFMGTPQNNKAGYDASSLLSEAGNLKGKLMLVHALMDENVHFEHTAAFIDALVAADKDFDLLVFPGERHGYRSPKARRYAYRRVIDYFAKHL